MATTTNSTQSNPFADGWIQTTLLPLATRAAAGNDTDELRDELFRTIWPWATATADRLARKTAAGGDAAEVRSTVLLAIWQTTGRVDWDRAQTWPALLKQRLAGACVDASRTSDVLSRRLRLAQRDLAAARREREQLLGRLLGAAEVTEVARSLWPKARPGWLAVVLGGQPEPPDPGGAVIIDMTERLERAEASQAVRCWLQDQLPTPLAEDLLGWFNGPRRSDVVPARLSRQLTPFVDDLRQRLAVAA